ncbi:hypothetical protein DID88_005539 [Monilinia fructigena]|uniref:Uncharacterized protein n=1 Tax=Monilinia fructigena TaxID=38457 RepID=A0A395J0V6_9HELO|nr:hypothetical protein DID88_005539 [Monilinia fructigena]
MADPSVVNRIGFAVLTAIEEASEEGTETSLSSIAMPTVRTPSEIFGRFILHLGPSMKSLAYTLSQILDELPFAEGPDYRITINEHFRSSLAEALKLYSNARAQALKELYKSKELDKTRPESIEADFEEVAASCGHFSFNLQDFAAEMQNYLAILEELKEEVERPKHRSWKWLMFWRKSQRQSKGDAINNEEQEQLIASSKLLQKSTRDPKEESYDEKAMRVVRFLDRDDIRFAVKVGLGAALYALFAFMPGTRPMYQHYRGEWGLLSYMLDSDHDDDEGGVRPIITEIAFHRVVAVLAGCIWGLIITRLVWPISARRKFKEGLSLLWLRMGLVWKERSFINNCRGYIFMLDKLRSSATSEFELRGPFPSATYGRIVEATTKMLDAFHAMNVVIQKNAEASEGEALLLKFTEEERAQLCARISHLFQVMASSMKLEYPLLTDGLPSTAYARDRLLAKIFQFRKTCRLVIVAVMRMKLIQGSMLIMKMFLPELGGLGLQVSGVQRRTSQGVTVKDEDYEIFICFYFGDWTVGGRNWKGAQRGGVIVWGLG